MFLWAEGNDGMIVFDVLTYFRLRCVGAMMGPGAAARSLVKNRNGADVERPGYVNLSVGDLLRLVFVLFHGFTLLFSAWEFVFCPVPFYCGVFCREELLLFTVWKVPWPAEDPGDVLVRFWGRHGTTCNSTYPWRRERKSCRPFQMTKSTCSICLATTCGERIGESHATSME